ncbi:PREDICTED: putative F-box/LRR-repeat/kelch-repeat protein At1g11620 [Camelina sativa]|uniref:F-box/LRR-repeat/kelch-repeat protein At1g11620 n=1 Tax=Camelina sativa TaxID=90675 RepID=A0ABM1R681_CAMSA|nr:PREDICTED: putative F-box/LRR-repeat/kelch-repeat protein At1g11620 [Camelina sativa]
MSHMHGREEQFTVFNDVSTVSPSLCSTISCVGMNFNDEPRLNFQVFKPLPSSDLLVRSVFHCDGLLLMDMRTKLLVSNPLLKQARWIKCGSNPEFDHPMDAYGLGYVSNGSRSCNDYKMVKFRCTEDIRAEVYDFKSDCWKVVVVVKNYIGFSGLPVSSVCLRGTPYWIGYNRYLNRTVSIQSFDFSKERFEPLFKFLHHSSIGPIQWQDSLSLGIFRGDHLSLLHEPRLKGRIHIWVMREKDWSKLMTVAIPQLHKFPKYPSYFIENNGKLVLSVRHFVTRAISIYVVGENQECQKFECYSSMEPSIGGSGCYYVPSLLLVPGFSS